MSWAVNVTLVLLLLLRFSLRIIAVYDFKLGFPIIPTMAGKLVCIELEFVIYTLFNTIN